MCQLCPSTDPSVHVTLRHNVGMLLVRQVRTTEAGVCATCLGRAFRKHQLYNLLFGWWGHISFFATFYHLIANTVVFFRARRGIARLKASS